MVFFVRRLADLILPWAARHATVWPSTHAQHGALLNGMAELEAENRRLRGAVSAGDARRWQTALRAMLDKHGCECGVCVEAQQALSFALKLEATA